MPKKNNQETFVDSAMMQADITDYAKRHDIDSRSEAIRRLVEIGLREDRKTRGVDALFSR